MKCELFLTVKEYLYQLLIKKMHNLLPSHLMHAKHTKRLSKNTEVTVARTK